MAPIVSEMRPPYSERARMSRPTSSVPKGNCADGGRKMNSGSAWFARSSGMNTGAIATVSTRAARTAPATMPGGAA